MISNDTDFPWVILPGIIPKQICEVLNKEGETLKLIPGSVGYDNREDKGYRDSLIGIFPDTHWIMGILFHYAAIENSARWNYDIQGPSPAQFATYEDGGFYQWHADTSEIPLSAQITRKITCILSISDGDDYQGGNLEIRLGTDSDDVKSFVISEARSQGSIVIFPSVVSHRVTPVTAGRRISITSWILGPQLR